MNLALWLERAGRSHGTEPAVGLGDRVVRNYAELAGRAARLAGALRQRFGLQPGDRVAIAAHNSIDYLDVLYAIWHAGLAAVPANAKLHGAELGYILEHSQARLCFASSDIEAAIAAHAPPTLERLITIGSADYAALIQADAAAITPRQGDDLAWLFYTSGTTGRPKGAMLTHRVLSAMSHAYATEVDPVAPGDAILHAAPMSHGSGLYIMAHVARLGINVVPESGGFEPAEIFRLFERWPRASMFAWAPIPEPFQTLGSVEFSTLLVEKAEVAVSPGIGFGEHGEGYVRIALVENEQRIRQAARNVRRFLETGLKKLHNVVPLAQRR